MRRVIVESVVGVDPRSHRTRCQKVTVGSSGAPRGGAAPAGGAADTAGAALASGVDALEAATKAKGEPWEVACLAALHAECSLTGRDSRCRVLDLTHKDEAGTREALAEMQLGMSPGDVCFVYQPSFCGCIECLPALYHSSSPSSLHGGGSGVVLQEDGSQASFGDGGGASQASIATTAFDGDVLMPARAKSGGSDDGAGGGSLSQPPLSLGHSEASEFGGGDRRRLPFQGMKRRRAVEHGKLAGPRLRCGKYRPDFLVVRCFARSAVPASSLDGPSRGGSPAQSHLAVDILDAKASNSVKLSHRVQVKRAPPFPHRGVSLSLPSHYV